ncbi:MAG: sugar ABC transporter permease [Caldilineaceae bacterium]|nr:sugar ABC transporter permease [Caldilineaceae bacterium]MBP8123076.1 sugar ABC transporter permease [Caldilineaceae bacterium]MBP9073386.1 sugar ABC transporter permease [Caldilineaceae bacterium]
MTELIAETSNLAKAPRKRIHWLPYALILPIILYEGVLIVYPILQGIYGSFTRIELASKTPPVWMGLANYERMFQDPEFWKVIQTTLVFTGLVILVALGAGLMTALIFNNPFRGRPVARGMLMMPWALPEVPVVMIFIWILSPQFGVVNILVRMLPGVTENPQWLQVPSLAMAWMVLIASWKAFPFYSLVILSALQSVPQELYEAAKVDGGNPLQLFWYITVPGIGTTLELLVVLASIFSFKQFTIIYLMTGGGPSGATETIVIRIYNTAFRFYDYSYATALGVAGLVVSLVIGIFFVILQARRAQETE